MKSLSNLTVGEYQQLYAIQKSRDENKSPEDQIIDKAISSISVIENIPRWEVENIPMDKFSQRAREITILFSGPGEQAKALTKIKVYGKRYRICLNPRKLSAGQWIDIQHFLKGNLIENLHKIMACLVVPEKFWGNGEYDGANHEMIAEGLLDCRFSYIHGTCVFFLLLWSNSIKAIAPSLSEEIQSKMGTNLLSTTDLQNIMDGSIMQSR